MLVELSVMEQRYQAVMAVIQDGWKVTEVAERLGVTRQSVHNWIARYEAGGLAALADRSHRPPHLRSPDPPELEAMICEIRRKHPGWEPLRILHELGKKRGRPTAGSHQRLSVPQAPQPDRAQAPQEAPRRVPSLGA